MHISGFGPRRDEDPCSSSTDPRRRMDLEENVSRRGLGMNISTILGGYGDIKPAVVEGFEPGSDPLGVLDGEGYFLPVRWKSVIGEMGKG